MTGPLQRQRAVQRAAESLSLPPPRGLGHRPRGRHVLEADVAGGNHPGHHLDREPACLHRRVVAAEPARCLGVARHDRDAAQPLVVLVDERASADEVAAIPQVGSEGEVPILELGRVFVRELRCVGSTARAARACAGRTACGELDQTAGATDSAATRVVRQRHLLARARTPCSKRRIACASPRSLLYLFAYLPLALVGRRVPLDRLRAHGPRGRAPATATVRVPVVGPERTAIGTECAESSPRAGRCLRRAVTDDAR